MLRAVVPRGSLRLMACFVDSVETLESRMVTMEYEKRALWESNATHFVRCFVVALQKLFASHTAHKVIGKGKKTAEYIIDAGLKPRD